MVVSPIDKLPQTAVNTAVVVLALILSSCNRSQAPTKTIEPVYSKKTGLLQELKYDSNANGKFDTFSYMNGAVIERIEIDQNDDGKIDRWEYYGPGQKLEKAGFSRAQDGVEDAWQYFDATGAVARIEMSTLRNRRIDRIEYYEQGVLVRAEEDTDHDGRMDKWETYDGERLAMVAFDETHRGTPDRRIVYAADGAVRIEVDPAGDGHFVEQAPAPAARRSR